MTENEAIEALKLEGGIEITGRPIRLAQFFEGIDSAIKDLEEVQQYRKIGTVEECREAVEKQPTAYDQDKVVEQLESELRLADKEKERCARENPLQFDSAKGYAMGLSNAIEIVKAGGTDAEN